MSQEAPQPSAIAQAYMERIEGFDDAVDYSPLCEPLLGFILILDPQDGALFVILDKTAFERKRDDYGHDMGTIIQGVIDQQSGSYQPSEWVDAHVPVVNRDAKLLTRQPGYIMKISDDGSANMEQLAVAISDAIDQAAISSEMLPPLEPLKCNNGEIMQLQSKGYLVQFYIQDAQPVAVVLIDFRCAIIDDLLGQTGPNKFMRLFINLFYPNVSLGEEQPDHPQIVFSFNRDESEFLSVPRVYAWKSEAEEQSSALACYFRLPVGISSPIHHLIALRRLIEDNIDNIVTKVIIEDDDGHGFDEHDLQYLTTDELQMLQRETKGMDIEARHTYVAEYLKEHGILDDKEEEWDEEDEEFEEGEEDDI